MTRKERIEAFLTPVTPHRRAIVVGGGIAGLLASRVLADHFDQVILLERDRYPDSPEVRAGVPQAKHVHILLLRGKQILEGMFPGLSAEMVANGAVVVETGKELAVLSYYGWRVQYSGELTLLTFTLPLLEWCLRRRLAEIAPVRSIDGCRVTGLVAGEEGRSVTGVRCHFSHDTRTEQNLYGELVVDASGRFSRAPEWLSALGYSRPEETVVDPFLGYASRLYEAPDGSKMSDAFRPGWKSLLLLGKPPDHTRGGALLPVEGNRWHITLAGVGKDYPPTDEAGFLEFARTLRSSVLYDAIRSARPLSPVTGYRATENRWRHYESLSRWPGRFVVLGDALCALNPVYGQGMSVAALEALTLDQCLREHNRYHGDTTGVAQQFQQQVANVVEIPWLMATREEFRWPTTKGERPGLLTRVVHRYLDTVDALATEHPEVDRTLAQVAHFVKPARTLFHPRIAIRVLAHILNPLSMLE